MFKWRHSYGFTLIEIMIVVAIISLLAAIAVPNLIRAKHDTNEKKAIATLKAISTAAESFRSAQEPLSYALDLKEMSSAKPPYIDINVANATQDVTATQGYYYNYARVDKDKFKCTAHPAVRGTTGTRIFFVDESGVVRLGNASGEVVE